MNDVAEKLKDWDMKQSTFQNGLLMAEGAAEIDRLEAVNAKLLAACKLAQEELIYDERYAKAHDGSRRIVDQALVVVNQAITEAENKAALV